MRVRLLIYLHSVKLGWISHLPLAWRVRDAMPYIFTHCLVCWRIQSCIWHVKNKRLLALVSENRAGVECVCGIICFFVPIQECPWRHFYLTRWEDSPKYLNGKAPWNWNSPTLRFVVANWLLHEPCWVQLHRFGKPLEGFNLSHIGEDWLNHIKVMQWYQRCHWMCCKKPEQVSIHIILALSWNKKRRC